MVLIVSNEEDHSTNDVIDWLVHYDVQYVRVNDTTPVSLVKVELSSANRGYVVDIEGAEFDSRSITAIWYRRGGFNIRRPDLINVGLNSSLDQRINAQLSSESATANDFIRALQSEHGLNSELRNEVNKLEVLFLALEMGFRVPSTLVTTRKAELMIFAKEHSVLVSKNITPGYDVSDDFYFLPGSTVQVSMNDLNLLPDEFPAVMFQEYVDKWIELRIVCVLGTYYSSAIFSQNDEQTKVDFRNYNSERPNRTPPFQLPIEVQKRLDALMSRLGLNSGSIDMLVTPGFEFVFLEVNPVGQFWQVSHPCNFGIERAISNHLRHGL